MNLLHAPTHDTGPGMAEYIIIVALIVMGGIGVYQAYGTNAEGRTFLADAGPVAAQCDGLRNAVVAQAGNTGRAGAYRKALKNSAN